MNRVQSQKGLLIPDFLDRYGTEEQCGAGTGRGGLADGPCLSGLRRDSGAHDIPSPGTSVLPVRRLPT